MNQWKSEKKWNEMKRIRSRKRNCYLKIFSYLFLFSGRSRIEWKKKWKNARGTGWGQNVEMYLRPCDTKPIRIHTFLLDWMQKEILLLRIYCTYAELHNEKHWLTHFSHTQMNNYVECLSLLSSNIACYWKYCVQSVI